MKKYISILIIGLFTTVLSCKKEVDVEAISQKLPKIAVTSVGIPNPGPYTTSSVVQILFGATITGASPGTFKLELLDGTTVAKTINFDSWSGKDNTSTPTVTNHTISFVTVPSIYPNTTIYQGTILLKLTGLTAGKTYSVRLTGSTNETTPTTSSTTGTSLLKVN